MYFISFCVPYFSACSTAFTTYSLCQQLRAKTPHHEDISATEAGRQECLNFESLI